MTGVGGTMVPLHHEAFLELLFDKSHSGLFGTRLWGDIGRLLGDLTGDYRENWWVFEMRVLI